MAAATHRWDEFNAWYDAYLDATYDEMEMELRKHRRVLMRQTLELTLQGGDQGTSAQAPRSRV